MSLCAEHRASVLALSWQRVWVQGMLSKINPWLHNLPTVQCGAE